MGIDALARDQLLDAIAVQIREADDMTLRPGLIDYILFPDYWSDQRMGGRRKKLRSAAIRWAALNLSIMTPCRVCAEP